VLGEEDEFVVLDQLESLVSKSLLRQAPTADEEPRFSMLQTIRERAQERLEESGDAAEVRERHATFYVDFAEQADANMRGPEQTAVLHRVEDEHPNLRAALRWAAEGAHSDLMLRMTAALADFWATRGYLSEGARWCAAAVELSEGQRTQLRGRLLAGASMIERGRGQFDRAQTLLEEAISIRRELGDDDGVASALRHLGALYYDKGDVETARELTEQSLDIRRRLGNTLGVAQALNNLGVMAQIEGDHERAVELYEESLALFRELGDKEGTARSLMNLGAVSRDVGELDRAARLLKESMRLWLELGDAWDMTDAMEDLAGVQCERGRWEVAATLFGAADGVRKGIGAQRNTADQEAYDRRVGAIRRELEPEVIEVAWEEGAHMQVAEIVAYAEVAT
jgi:non-specific serine/threonine protein kinase